MGGSNHHRGREQFLGLGPKRREYGVYLVDGTYFVSTWMDMPSTNAGAIDKFFANDKRDALIKGEAIAELHAEAQAKLPEAERVRNVLRDPHENEYAGYYGV